jgi:hypothetical protein
MKPKPDQIRGSHHCIGTSRITADAIFGIIHSRAVANGGTISIEAINDAKAQFIESLPSGIDLFEKINRECMAASKSTAPDPFSSDMILSTLLAACGDGSAKHAFKIQLEHCGNKWLDYFFQGFAQNVQKNLGGKTWGRLRAAFVHSAEKRKGNTQISDLLNRNEVKEVLLECISPFSKSLELDEFIKSTGATINNYIANTYTIAGPFIAKITDDQMKRFITMLLNELPIKLVGDSQNGFEVSKI